MSDQWSTEEPGLRVLVTGGGGQLGRELVARARKSGWHPISTGRSAGPEVDLIMDITDQGQVVGIFRHLRPDLVIHAAAMTDVEGCELNGDMAWVINLDGSRIVAEAAREISARVISVSTDFVYSGLEPPYVEASAAAPLSVYGETKLAGDIAVLETDDCNSVVRTAWIYGGPGKHFPRTVLSVLSKQDIMEVVEDERGNPTYAADLADAIISLASLNPTGIYHLANSGSASRFEMAALAAKLAGFDSNRVQPTTVEKFLETYPLKAKRPKDSTLMNIRGEMLGVRMRPWEDALASYIPLLVAELGVII